MDGADHWQGRGGDEEVIRYFMTGAPIIFQFIELLQDQSPKLKEAPDVEKCDFILFFCQSFSETKTAIESALQELPSTEPAKPVLLVVLHYTLDPDIYISDSSQYVTRENMFTVDCLVCEENLLQCTKNDEALTKAKEWIEPEIEKQRPEMQHEHPCASTDLTNKPGTAELQEVSTEQDCDVFLHDIDAAVRTLSDFPASRPAVLFVLHHTSDPNIRVSEVRSVNRRNTLTVEFLVSEDKTLLNCPQNDEAVCKVSDWLIPEVAKEALTDYTPQVETKPVKSFVHVTGRTSRFFEDFVRIFCKQRPTLQLSTEEECDFVLVFCPVDSSAGTDTEAALHKLGDISATKPAVQVVLHLTLNPDSNRAVTRKNTITVDCLICEGKALLKCTQTDNAHPEESNSAKSKGRNKRPCQSPPVETKPVKIFSCATGKTLGSHEDFVKSLCKQRPTLQEVLTVEDCDVALVFVPVVSRAGTDIEAALKKLSAVPTTKPAVLVVLHHTFDPDSTVPDSSRAVNREKTLTVDCLFHEDKGLLQCNKNGEALCKVADWLIPEGSKPPKSNVKEDQPNEYAPPVKISPVRIFTLVTGKTLGSHKDFVRILCKRRTALQEVLTVEECDVALVFCPVVSRAGSDITGACEKLDGIPATKPAVLVVLHHTFDPDSTVPDSSRAVNREKTLTVDCLFHEDKGLLQCKTNDDAFRRVSMWIDTQAGIKTDLESIADTIQTKCTYYVRQTKSKALKKIDNCRGRIPEMTTMFESKISNAFSLPQKNKGSSSVTGVSQDLQQFKLRLGKLNFFTCVTGKTLGSHKKFLEVLYKRRAELQEVPTVEECDVILAFCPVGSVPGIDTKNALQQLNDVSGSKPAVLVVLHHTFDPELIVPDSSRSVNREKTLAVDCLFHEDKGLLHCGKNDEALSRVSEWIESQIKDQERIKEDNVSTNVDNSLGTITERNNRSKHRKDHNQSEKEFKKESSSSPLKYLCITNGNTLNTRLEFLRILKKYLPELQETSSVEECDVILEFCSVSPAVHNEVVRQRICASKPAILVVLHNLSDPEKTITDSGRSVTREDAVTVDCWFLEDKGILQCPENSEAFSRVLKWLRTKR
ncbi:hypothetical protein AOLI_G00270410 [Acnodon oligacanthus]